MKYKTVKTFVCLCGAVSCNDKIQTQSKNNATPQPTPPSSQQSTGSQQTSNSTTTNSAVPTNVQPAQIDLKQAEFTLARDNKALASIAISKGSSARIHELATTLAAYLKKISGASFDIQETDSPNSGIVFGLAKDIPALAKNELATTQDITRNDDYLLLSHSTGLVIAGVTENALSYALWDVLYRVGYRQYFPGTHWEIIPTLKTVSLNLSTQQHPKFLSRQIIPGWGRLEENEAAGKAWAERNRMGGAVTIDSSHAFELIYQKYKSVFDAHPEYLALVAGSRTSDKFCLSNPALRQLIVDYALDYFDKNPNAISVSVEPSDGDGWCECPFCKALGSPSNRIVTLANQVAQAVTAKYPQKYVAFYAYNQHSAPPTIKVASHVVVNIATEFRRGGYSMQELLDGWSAQGAQIGIREYYSVAAWDRDKPGEATAGKLDMVASTLKQFANKNALYFVTEAGDNWGPYGLGYYEAARLLWDTSETVDSIKDDFLTNAFGAAKPAMTKFYDLINGKQKPLLSTDLVGRMYRDLKEAKSQTTDASTLSRIDDLLLYTRYVEMIVKNNPDLTDAANCQAILKYLYRIRTTMMTHSYGLHRDIPTRNAQCPTTDTWYLSSYTGYTVVNEPFSSTELTSILETGIASNTLFDFTPVSYSHDLVPANSLKSITAPDGSTGYRRYKSIYYTYLPNPQPLPMNVKGGLIYNGSQGPIKASFFPALETLGRSVSDYSIPADQSMHGFSFSTTFAGLHRIEIDDNGDGTEVVWSHGLPMTIPATSDEPFAPAERWTLYFYVPKGTSVVAGYAEASGSTGGTLEAGNGSNFTSVYTFTKDVAQYFKVTVPSGSDGKLWRFNNNQGARMLLTVPSYFARNAKELLLPKEVVSADGL